MTKYKCSKTFVTIFVIRDQKIMKMVPRSVLDQFWAKEIIFTQTVMFVTVPIKNTCRNFEYFFMKCIFFLFNKSPSLFSNNKIYMALLRLRKLDKIIFSSECLVDNIYYFVTWLLFSRISFSIFFFFLKIVISPFSPVYQFWINHPLIFKKKKKNSFLPFTRSINLSKNS